MIVFDIEMSGLNLEKSGIWQIGAIDLLTKEEFLDESRIDDEDEITEEALKIIGKSEEELRDKKKQSQKELLEKFLAWLKGRKETNFICQNPQFDISFIFLRAQRYGIKENIHFRAFDLHTIAQIKYKEINNEFSLKEKNGDIYSDMNLSKILSFCGLEDKRRLIHEGEIIQEGTPHNALEDCKLEGECYYRLIHGKNLFPEFSQYKIPEELRK
jgi:DNA polymerase III epsilon subunit-like protein